MTAPPPLALRLLGAPTVMVGDRAPPPAVLWRKHLALLGYLALSPHMSRSRAHLQTLFWPEKDTARARHSLNEAVRHLRAGLGAGRVHSHAGTVVLDDRDLVVDALDAAAEESDAELLEGLSLADAPDFDEWLATERRELRRRRVARRVDAARQALAAQQLAPARAFAERALALEPLAEPAVAAAMRGAALQGDRATALRLYQEFVERLAAEVGTPPGQDLAGLAQRIRDGRWRSAPPRKTPPPPLVGRAEIHEQVFGLVQQAFAGRSAVLAVEGATGLGKSRLLDEIADRWRLDGGTAVVALPVEQDQEVAWSSLRDLFRRGLATAPGLPAAAPDALATLAAIVPGLPTRLTPTAPRDVAEMGTALGSVLGALAEEAPLALLLDAADTADGPTVAALHAALARAQDLPVLAVVAYGAAPRALAELTALVGRIGRDLHGTVVTLHPLSPDETRAIVDVLAPWCADPIQQDRLSRRLHFDTGGSPLLLTTLLQGLAEFASLRGDALVWPPPERTLQAPLPAGVPELVRLVTAARMRQMSPRSRAFLCAACVGGRVVDPMLTRHLASLDEVEADQALADLEQHGFLTYDGTHYVFEAPLIAQVIVTTLLKPGERHRLEQRRAALLDPARPSMT